MELYIPFITIFIITLLFTLQIIKYKNLCKYLSATYPAEWQKLFENALGVSVFSITNANVAESFKTGFFSTVADKQILKFQKYKIVNLGFIGLLTTIQFVAVIYTTIAV